MHWTDKYLETESDRLEEALRKLPQIIADIAAIVRNDTKLINNSLSNKTEEIGTDAIYHDRISYALKFVVRT